RGRFRRRRVPALLGRALAGGARARRRAARRPRGRLRRGARLRARRAVARRGRTWRTRDRGRLGCRRSCTAEGERGPQRPGRRGRRRAGRRRRVSPYRIRHTIPRMLGSVLTAIATPFDENGKLDFDAFQRLAQYLVDHGSDGLVVVGTTGESPTLSDSERNDL